MFDPINVQRVRGVRLAWTTAGKPARRPGIDLKLATWRTGATSNLTDPIRVIIHQPLSLLADAGLEGGEKAWQVGEEISHETFPRVRDRNQGNWTA